MKRFLPKLLFPLILIAISSYLCFKNYSPGTYLIGWDSLHPEFNFPEALRRVWEGVYRVEQGLGAVAAHSHMADLPRIIFLWLESFIIPASFLRYSYIFLCLVVGPLGMYFFLRYTFQREKESVWIVPSAFLGALYYLLNLGTLQNFYVPFEMFPVAFAGIPWIAFCGIKYLREGNKSNLFFLALVIVLSSPMAYAATLWYASFAGLFLFFAIYTLVSSAKKSKFKRLFVIVISTILLNLYWILPNIYSITTQSKVISNANINRLFSPEAFLRNRDYGDFTDILLQKNFLFGWRNFNFSEDKFVNLLQVWTNRLSDPLILKIGICLGGIAILGLFLSLVKRNKTGLALTLPLLFTLFFLLNINPPLGNLYSYLYNHYGVFAEGFRMPFSKFSLIYEFIAAFYFGYFVYILFTINLRKNRFLKALLAFIKIIIFGATISALAYFMLPIFQGHLIGTNVRVSMPSEYLKLFDYLNSNEYGKVALFPINSKYGWEYRNWVLPAGRQGYEGSGFLTYGTRDPILYRDFDRWLPANEDFFNQASFALYWNDKSTFISTLKKYQVKYILLDESIINPGGKSDVLKIAQIKDIFGTTSGIRQVANFGFLTLYRTDFDNSNQSFSSSPEVTLFNTDLAYSVTDPIYPNFGDYANLFGGINLPFINLDKRSETQIKIEGSDIAFTDIASGNILKLPIHDVITEDFSVNRGFPEAYNCDLDKQGTVNKSNSPQGILYQATGGAASCDYLGYPSLKYNQAYVMRVSGENKQGRSLKIYLFDSNSEIPSLEEMLPEGKFDESFFLQPKGSSESGYVLNYETRSFGRIASENFLTKVEFYPVDYKTLLNYSTDGKLSKVINNLKVLYVKKYGISAYKVDIQGSGLIQFGQGYDKGWVAVQPQDSKLLVLQHTKINSWANGWVIPPADPANYSTIYIIFLPQLLEWGGFLAGGITFLVLVFKRK